MLRSRRNVGFRSTIRAMSSTVSERGHEVAKQVGLEPGERVMFCPKCSWIGEKNAIGVPECPICQYRPVHFVSES